MAYDFVWERGGPLPPSRSAGPSDWLILTAGSARADEAGDSICLALQESGGRVTVARCAARGVAGAVKTWQQGLSDDTQAAVVLLCTGPLVVAGARETNLVAVDVARALASSTGAAGRHG